VHLLTDISISFFSSIVQSVSLETGALTGSYNGHSNLVTSIVQNALCNRIFKAGNSKDEIVVSTSLDGSVLVWDVVRNCFQ